MSTIMVTTVPVPSEVISSIAICTFGFWCAPIQCMTASSNRWVPPARTCLASLENAHVPAIAIAAPDTRKMPNTV